MEKLNDTQLDSGDQLRWECKATGKPRPTYRWLKNGLPIWTQVQYSVKHLSIVVSSLIQVRWTEKSAEGTVLQKSAFIIFLLISNIWEL